MKKMITSVLVITILSVGLNVYQFMVHQQERNILTVSDMQKLHNFVHNIENYPSSQNTTGSSPDGMDPGHLPYGSSDKP